jgi:hypothetical protein
MLSVRTAMKHPYISKIFEILYARGMAQLLHMITSRIFNF